MMRALVLIAALAACTTAKKVGGEIGGHVAEWIACPFDFIDCGHVYMCEAFANNELGHVEICIDDDDHPEDVDAAELLFGPCDLTPRHEGLCVWGCPPDAPGLEPGRGCNAFGGPSVGACFCP